MHEWRFLSNHGSVLLCVARNPRSRLRDIAECVGITERAAHRLVCDLVEDGYLVKSRVGNRNRYELRPEVPMRDPMLEDHWVGELLAVLGADSAAMRGGAPRPSGAAAGTSG